MDVLRSELLLQRAVDMQFHVFVGLPEIDRLRIDQPQVGHSGNVGDVLGSHGLRIRIASYAASAYSGANPVGNVVALPLMYVDRGLAVLGLRAGSAAIENLQHARIARKIRNELEEGVERLYNPLPLHHANALSISLPTMLVAGGCLVFPDRFHASTFWDDIVNCNVTAIQFQGVIPAILLKLPEQPQERAHRVKFVLCAGCEPGLHEPFERRYGFPLVEMWAMTETGRMTTDHVEPRMIHTRALGRSVPGAELRAVDADDNEVPAGKPGELVIRHSARSPRQGFFSGYLKNKEATEEAWRNGWFHTGDMVQQDESGMYFFLDRAKNIIRRAGENIPAAEVEERITAHDKVKQVAVLAVTDEVREEEVMALVIPKRPEDANEAFARELFDYCNERLAYFKTPGYFLFVQSLPTTSSQKIQKVRIFAPGVDPRKEPGVIDLRSLKKPARTSKSTA